MSLPQQSAQGATRIVCEGPIGAQARSTWTTTPLEDALCWLQHAQIVMTPHPGCCFMGFPAFLSLQA